jgi:hypothetical protein
LNGYLRLVRDLKLHRPSGLLLHDDGAIRNRAALKNVADTDTHQVTSTQLAVDCQIKQGKVSNFPV